MLSFNFLESASKASALSWLHLAEGGVIIASLLVVIGLIGELPHATSWEKFFAVIVTLGVAGELLGDGLLYEASERLQAISDQEIDSASRQAGTAINRQRQLQNLNDRLTATVKSQGQTIANAGDQIDSLTKAENALGKILKKDEATLGQHDARLNAATKRLSDLNKKTTSLASDADELVHAMAPRCPEITPPTVASVSKYKALPVYVVSVEGDEPEYAAGCIESLFAAAGFRYNAPTKLPLELGAKVRPGVHVEFSLGALDSPKAGHLALTVAKWLCQTSQKIETDDGISHQVETLWTGLSLDSLLIVVGKLPNTFFETKQWAAVMAKSGQKWTPPETDCEDVLAHPG